MHELGGWTNFYVIVGSSAGALIGLQFVVLTLIADMPFRESADMAGRAFSTPTIIYFGTVLLLSAVLNAPWKTTAGLAYTCGAIGVIGVIYAVIVVRNLRAQTLYQPVFEDWLFHAVLPLTAYLTLAVAAYLAMSRLHEALFAVAAASLLLLFIAIHNAWDGVTYHVFNRSKPGPPEIGNSA